MDRRQFTSALGARAGAVLALGRPVGAALGLALVPAAKARAAGLTEGDAATGVRAALERGAAAAVSALGRQDGFNANPAVHIPLPPALNGAARLLRTIGRQHEVDDLVLSMNRAAEAAVPEARDLLVQAVRSMSVEDALRLVRGSDTAVTEFFAGKTRAPLGERFLPIVSQATQRVSLAAKYNLVAGRAGQFGLVHLEDPDVEHYVTRKALDGLFAMIGEEERRIRQDPVATGSALLRQVFGH